MGKFYAEIFAELEVYIKHLAWLHAVPDDDSDKTRLEVIESLNLVVEYPDCEAQYILDYLFEVGLTLGENPLTHLEISSWQSNIGLELQPFEVRFIKRLSEIYLSASHKMKLPDSETPWEDAPKYMSLNSISSQKSRIALRKLAGGE